MKKKALVLLVLNAISLLAFTQTVNLASPDGNLQFKFRADKKLPRYEITFKKQPVIGESTLSLDFDNGAFGQNVKVGKPFFETGNETYELIVGKAKTVKNHYNGVTIPLQENSAPHRIIHLEVRAFDDGIAFRYELPVQPNWTSFVMYDEHDEFNVAGNPKVTALPLPSYTSSHEGLYTKTGYNALKENELMDMPALFELPNKISLAITEASVRDYAGMYLMKKDGKLISKLSPSLKDEKVKVVGTLPHQSPWRVLMISDRVGALIESNILTNLNEPCKIEDTSWIKPGKTTFTWWNGNVVPDTTFMPGNNFETNKYYIDFAARNQLDYHSIYGFAETPWYTDNGFDFGTPGTEFDITKPIASLDMQAICNYAKSKGVRIHLWLNWKALYPKLDEAFAQFEKWGIAGMMVDFMDRDDQEMINIQEEILAKAAKHHLFIQFHGSSKPSGLHRTYPNEFIREGTLNYEVYKWNDQISADHDISMPFTRLLAGAADYHLGGFRATTRAKYKAQFANPFVTSTRCHMLGMYVVLESYLAMVCDTPAAYEGQPGFEYIQQLPQTWHQTVVPDAVANEYVVVARRNGYDWFVGSINNSTARTVACRLDFLDDGIYDAEIYTDAPDADANPNHLTPNIQTVKKGDTIQLPLAADGGAAIRMRRRIEMQ